MPEYQQLTEDELLQLAGEREHLTDDARLALDAELSRRRLSSADIESHHAQCDEWDQQDKRRRAVRTYIPDVGLGKTFLGRANRHRDPSDDFEYYDSTLWFVVLWFPVFPIATYTVRRDLKRWLGMTVASNPIAVERHPRNWEQILVTWIKAVLVLWLIVLLFRHPEWVTYLLKRLPHTS